MIPALVLTAGLATRLRPLSFVRAKAALPIGELAIIQRILRWLAGHGVADAVLNLHHLPHTITRIVGDGAAEQVRVRYSWEMPVLGSAGGPRHALPLLASPAFLVVNGDTLTNVDMGRLLHAHERSGALVTMAVIPNTEPAKYGGVVADNRGIVTGFTRAGSTEPSFHFIGVQVVEGAAFVSLPDNMPAESVKDVYPALIAARPGSIRAFITDAEFFDIGTPRDYFDTCMRFRAKEPADSRLRSPGSRVEDAIVWDDVHIDPQAQLRRCIVTDGVRVPSGSWENMIIRHANGDLAANEQRVDDLAIASIDGSPLR
jgi:NDP-sugar pyrophosphorylase family protein